MNSKKTGVIILGCIAFLHIACSGDKKTQAQDTSDSMLEKSSAISEKPNIIFYLADDQDVYDYGCYGNEKVHTPAVDALAKDGILFTNAFTAQAICAPSRSQLFTGKYPLKNGCFANHTGTRSDIKSVTTHMKKLGYEVVLAGKSHVKPENVYQWDREWEPVPKQGVPRDYIPLDSIAAYLKNAKKPFCMFITSKYPHGKYFDVEHPKASDIKFYPFNENKKTDKTFIKTKAGYYRSIEEDNTQLEEVLKLVDTYLTDNTLFIYSADHGVSGKFTVKDIGLKVPFVARWPKVIKPGSTSNQLIHYTDVLPTFMEIAGGKFPEDMDGNSFLPLLQGKDVEVNNYVYGVRTNQNILNSEIFPSRMIRDKRYKYIRNFNSIEVVEQNLTGKPNVNYFIERGAKAHKNEPFEELYDLQNDPFEQHNLASNPDYKSIKEKLIKDMFSWMKAQGDILSENMIGIPIITPKGNRGFKLDQDTPRRKIPEARKNTLTKDDYIVIEHW
ncbi:arylsulfatase [Formosa agariphila KMM 3901]|uniref:Ulvan-active sulfatase n=1 Tax=Formosa agariphila (strain DSM 15362 / KCTC 12365 / LMG 23005 / KMM 3901 / M-2Alg 35-1) TaxID=1347342 RepID=PLH12_FORAG|nr:sulfatase [Formosa agariphila]T2KN71.1 RecName: Full=Ulvan-active sulfatase; AltName: Full=Arylsulfatase; AltName: Full=Polysaccharide utilization locus H protein P12; Short=PUL H protein P12; AltName: Full=Sulfatase family S1 subfamily 8 protein P12; Short=P12_S1_8; Flags: Precursor [Formosa agariphila KMM 3901]CDF79913.1 arylsulfatase [Formosa agariphila KMM 3901]